jgi:hypothetical protein
MQANLQAMDEVKTQTWFQGTEVFLYRGAWQVRQTSCFHLRIMHAVDSHVICLQASSCIQFFLCLVPGVGALGSGHVCTYEQQ